MSEKRESYTTTEMEEALNHYVEYLNRWWNHSEPNEANSPFRYETFTIWDPNRNLYGTTKEFLLHFGLKDLSELPKIEEFAEVLGEEVDVAGLKRAIEAPRPVEVPLSDEEGVQGELPLEAPADDPSEDPTPDDTSSNT